MMHSLKTVLYLFNIILYFVTVAVWIMITDEMLINLVVTSVTMFLSLGLIWTDRHKWRKVYESHKFIGHVNTGIRAFLLFCIFGLLNYWAYKHPAYIDLSLNQMNSLSPQTKKILDSVNEKMKMKIFARSSQAQALLSLVELYRLYQPLIQYEFIDIDLRPDLALSENIQKSGTVVLEYQDRKNSIELKDELSLTNGVITIARQRPLILYWLTGHGEVSLEDSGDEGASYLKTLFQTSAYIIKELDLMEQKQVPEDASVVVVMGPKRALFSEEVKALEHFLNAKGKLVVALDPHLNGDPFSQLRSLFEQRGLALNNDLVVDQVSYVAGSNGSVPLIKNFSVESPVTKDFKGEVFFPLVSSVEKVETKMINGVVKVLATTSGFPASWAEKDLKEVLGGVITFNNDRDFKGPISVVGTWEEVSSQKERGKLALIGNSRFIQNAYQRFSSNYAFLMNILAWMTNEDQLLSFSGLILKNDPVLLGPGLRGFIFYFAVIFAPFTLFIIAGTLFYRRRRP